MNYNPRTEQAMAIEAVAEQCRQAVQRLATPGPGQIVWSDAEHRWVKETHYHTQLSNVN